MTKTKTLKPYEGPLEDLVAFGAEPLVEIWIVRLQGRAYSLGHKKKDAFHTSEGRAIAALRNHIYCNFCQGHYWHKGKKNTFAYEQGWQRNSGHVSGSEKEFKQFAKEMTDWLLEQKIFTVERVWF